jgi:hypothetical protein
VAVEVVIVRQRRDGKWEAGTARVQSFRYIGKATRGDSSVEAHCNHLEARAARATKKES